MLRVDKLCINMVAHQIMHKILQIRGLYQMDCVLMNDVLNISGGGGGGVERGYLEIWYLIF